MTETRTVQNWTFTSWISVWSSVSETIVLSTSSMVRLIWLMPARESAMTLWNATKMPVNKPALPPSPLCVAAFHNLGDQSSMPGLLHRCWFLPAAGEYRVVFCQVNILCFYSFKEKMRPIFLKSLHFYLTHSSPCFPKLLSCLVLVCLFVEAGRGACHLLCVCLPCVFVPACIQRNCEMAPALPVSQQADFTSTDTWRVTD